MTSRPLQQRRCFSSPRGGRDVYKRQIDMCILRFHAFSRLEEELADARNALDERKIIDQAKLLIMQARGLEAVSYTHLDDGVLCRFGNVEELAHWGANLSRSVAL